MEPGRLLFATAAVLLLCVLLIGASLVSRTRRPLEQQPADARLRAWVDEATRRPTRRGALRLVRRLGRWPNAASALEPATRERVRSLVLDTGAAGALLHWLSIGPKGRRLGALRLAPWLDVPGAEERLRAAVTSEDPDVAHAAATALSRYPSPRAYSTLLQQLDGGVIPGSRVAALLESAEPAVLRPLAGELAHDPSPQRRFWAAYLLGQHGTDAQAAVLLRLAGDDDENVRANAAEALGRLGERDGTDPRSALHDLLQDPSWVVQAHALRALARIGAGPSRTRIEALKQSPHWWVRYRAETVLRPGVGAEA